MDDNTDSARLGLRPQEQRAWLSGGWFIHANINSEVVIVTKQPSINAEIILYTLISFELISVYLTLTSFPVNTRRSPNVGLTLSGRGWSLYVRIRRLSVQDRHYMSESDVC